MQADTTSRFQTLLRHLEPGDSSLRYIPLRYIILRYVPLRHISFLIYPFIKCLFVV